MSERASYGVTYEGVEIRLTVTEYLALRIAAMDDPVEADRLARDHLARQQQESPAAVSSAATGLADPREASRE